MKTTYIITGTNKGLGHALVALLFQRNPPARVLSVNRTPASYAVPDPERYARILVDLDRVAEIEPLLMAQKAFIGDAERIVFIVNAATIAPIEAVGSLSVDDVIRSVNVNTASPVIMTNFLVREFPQQKLAVMNISSGAATKPMEGWAAYCASKAYTKMFFEVLEKEQAAAGRVTVHQLSPGVIDTPMQEQIRAASLGAFPQRQRFLDYKTNNQLQKPEDVAARVLATIDA